MNQFEKSDQKQAQEVLAWLDGKDPKTFPKWIVKGRIPGTVYAITELAPSLEIACVKKQYGSPGKTGRGKWTCIVHAQRGNSTRIGAGYHEDSRVAAAFAYRNAIRQLATGVLNETTTWTARNQAEATKRHG